jgi:uncharacterized PurR-regulated membrane protein YhhQ (DUF165 family)
MIRSELKFLAWLYLTALAAVLVGVPTLTWLVAVGAAYVVGRRYGAADARRCIVAGMMETGTRFTTEDNR